MFQRRPEPGEIDSLGVIDKKRRVRVTDIRAHRPRQRAEGQINFVGVDCTGERNLAPGCARGPHVDDDAPVRQDLGFEQSGDGLDPHARVMCFAIDEAGDAACGIAASLGFAAIGIADAHRQLRGGMVRRLE